MFYLNNYLANLPQMFSSKIKLNKIEKIIVGVVMALAMAFLGMFIVPTFANTDQGAANSVFKMILNIVCIIVIIVGVFFTIMGVVKFAIAHANEQAPEQQKAIMQLATGVVLIILPAILMANRNTLANIINNALKTYSNKS